MGCVVFPRFGFEIPNSERWMYVPADSVGVLKAAATRHTQKKTGDYGDPLDRMAVSMWDG